MSPALTRICRWLLSALMWCGVMASSVAQIVESKEPLIGNPEFKILEQFRDNFGWPAPEIRKGQSVLYVFAEGPSYKVVAVGPTTSDPKAYAEKLDAWKSKQGLPGSVQYARQKSAAVAVYTYSTTGFGKAGYSLELPLASLPREVKLEDVTNCALVFFRVTGPPSALPGPTFVGQDGLKYWNLSATPAKSDIRISEALAGWIFPFLSIVSLLPIVGVVAAFIYAKPIRQQTDVPDLERETLFFKSMQPIVVAVLSLHFLISLPVIGTRSLDPLVALWFGTEQIGSGLLVLVALTALPSLLYTILLRRIYKLEGQADMNIVSSGQPMDDEPFRIPYRIPELAAVLPHLVILLTLLVGAIIPVLPFEWLHGYKSSWIILSSVFQSFFPYRISYLTAPSKAIDLSTLQEKARIALSIVEKVIGKTDKQALILRTRYAEFEIHELGHEIQIPEWWVRRSSIEEIAFSMLHSIWFTVSKPVGDTAFSLLAFLAGAVPYVLFVFQSRLPGVTDLVRYASLLLPVTVGIIYWRMRWLNTRDAMFATDARVVEVTQNPSAAISALERMSQIEVVRKGRLSFPLKPTCRERIERIQERLAP